MTKALLVCTNALKPAAEAKASNYDGGSGTFSRALTSNGANTALSIDCWMGAGEMPTELIDGTPSDMFSDFMADGRFEGQALSYSITMPQVRAWMDAHIPKLYFYTGVMPE